MATQEERYAQTQDKLLRASRQLFAKRGYAATGIEDITRAAGLTKGAFYHHFADKQAVFLAVFEAVETDLVKTAMGKAVGADPWQRFRAGCRAFLETALDPEIQRIALRDAPAVLGWDQYRAIDSRHGLGLIETGLRAAIASGQVTSRHPTTLAQIVIGMLCEGARLVAGSSRPGEQLERVSSEIDLLLEGFAARPAARTRTRAPRAAAARARG